MKCSERSSELLREEIYELHELKGADIARIILSKYKKISTGLTIEERLETISTLWVFLEKSLDTSDRELMHPYLKNQEEDRKSVV